MASQDDLYANLGVPPDATSEQIKQAYHDLARKYHPDKNQGTTRLGTHFQRAARAYATLSNAESRAAYDAEMGMKPKRGSRRRRLDPSVLPPGFDGRPRPRPAPQPGPAPSPPVTRPQAGPDQLVPWWDRHFILSQCMLIASGLLFIAVVYMLISAPHV